MPFTVRDALTLPSLTRGTVMAGETGLDREIKSITVQEIINEDPFAFKFLTPGTFVVSSLYAAADNIDTQVSLIRRLNDCQVSALAIFNVGRVLPQISRQLTNICNELNLPLIKMPVHASYYEVLMPIIDKLLANKVNTLENIIHVYETFSSHLMNVDEDYSSMLDMLGEMTGLRLAFFNHNQKCIYSTWDSNGSMPPKELLFQLRGHSTGHSMPEGPLPLTANGKRYLVQPVCSNTTYYGILILENTQEPTPEMIKFYIRQTSQALCVILLNSERQDKYRKRLRREYLYDLIMDNLGDRMQIVSQGKALDFPVERVDRVLVISLVQNSSVSHRKSVPELMQNIEIQIKHIFSSSIPVLIDEFSEIVLLTSGKSPKNMAYMGRWLSSLLLPENTECLVGISSVCGGPEQIAACYQEARQAIRISRQLFSQSPLPYVFYEDIKIFALLQGSIKREKAAEVVSELLGEVEQYDALNNSQLGETFFRLLTSNVSTSQVAQQMFLHKNTVLQRKNRLAGFYNKDPFDGANHLPYELAFILKKLFEL